MICLFFKLNSYLPTLWWLILSQTFSHLTQTAIESDICKGKVKIWLLPVINCSLELIMTFFQFNSSPHHITYNVPVHTLNLSHHCTPPHTNTNRKREQGRWEYFFILFLHFSQQLSNLIVQLKICPILVLCLSFLHCRLFITFGFTALRDKVATELRVYCI